VKKTTSKETVFTQKISTPKRNKEGFFCESAAGIGGFEKKRKKAARQGEALGVWREFEKDVGKVGFARKPERDELVYGRPEENPGRRRRKRAGGQRSSQQKGTREERDQVIEKDGSRNKKEVLEERRDAAASLKTGGKRPHLRLFGKKKKKKMTKKMGLLEKKVSLCWKKNDVTPAEIALSYIAHKRGKGDSGRVEMVGRSAFFTET